MKFCLKRNIKSDSEIKKSNVKLFTILKKQTKLK